MSLNDTLPAADTETLEDLRTALAINRAMGVVADIIKGAEDTVEHHEAKRRTYLNDLLIRINRDLFIDWENTDPAAPTDHIAGPHARVAVREAIQRLITGNGNGNGTSAHAYSSAGLFDSNGLVIHHSPDELSSILARFYKDMRAIKPFAYGNKLTLDVFLVALSKLPAFREVYPAEIDFRRLSEEDRDKLYDNDSSLEACKNAFAHAIDTNRTPRLHNEKDGHGTWPRNASDIADIPFLSYNSEEHGTCLVTANGGLVPLGLIKETLESYLVSNQQFANFGTAVLKDKIVGFVPNTENLRAQNKHDIDGIAVDANGVAPLVCLDANILTGLRTPSHDRLLAHMQRQCGKSCKIFDLANNPELKAELMQAAPDEQLREIIEIASLQLSVIVSKLDLRKDELLAHCTPSAEPLAVVTMGGAGCGKTGVENLMRNYCGDNFVVTSLDAFRSHADLYKLLQAVDHHGDDYAVIEPFANTMRDWVAAGAKERRLNIIYDGTGIPYGNRYDKTISQYKEAGYQTMVACVDAHIDTAISRVSDRHEREKRALPWIVVIGKHTKTPKAFLQAVSDPKADKTAIFCNDGPYGSDYLMGESFILSDAELHDLQQQLKAGSLSTAFQAMMQQRPDSIANRFSNGGGPETITSKIPTIEEGNVSFLSYRVGGANRVLAIYDATRFRDVLEKGQMNPHAASQAGLLHAPEALAFHMPETGNPSQLNLQKPSASYTEKVEAAYVRHAIPNGRNH